MRIFLSHATEAKARVRELVAHFPPHVEVWLDVDEMSTGVRLPEHIAHAIEYECDFVLVFVDAQALDSEWVKRETGLALQRETDLKRPDNLPFLLPVLLEPLGDQLSRLGELGERIHFDATDASPDGVARAGERLCGELFAHASRLIESLRSSGRRSMLGDFAADVNDYKQAAFLWIGELANPLGVLATNQQAFDNVRHAVEAYNGVADRVIPALNTHRHRISAAWSGYRGLTQDFRDLTDFLENRVYRDALFALNEVHAMIHELAAADAQRDAMELKAMEARRDELLAAARDALQTLTQRSTRIVAEFEREI